VDRITDILVIVNPLVKDQPAAIKAATLARWLGASIELLACDTKTSQEARAEGGGGLPALGNAFPSDNLQSLLEQIAEPLRDDGIDVTTHVISGDPLHEAVTTWMRNSPADLVVKDTHHHSFAKRTFATNTDWHLIRTCAVPLLLTKPKAWGTPPVLMAAVGPGHTNDPSSTLDHRILDVAASMAKQFDAHVHAVHAYVPSTMATAAAGDLPPMAGVSAEALAAEKKQRRYRIKQISDHTKSPTQIFMSMSARPRNTCRGWRLNGMRTSSSWAPSRAALCNAFSLAVPRSACWKHCPATCSWLNRRTSLSVSHSERFT